MIASFQVLLLSRHFSAVVFLEACMKVEYYKKKQKQIAWATRFPKHHIDMELKETVHVEKSPLCSIILKSHYI